MRGKIHWESDSGVKAEISPLTSGSPCGEKSLVPDVLAVTQKIGCPLFLGVNVSLLDAGENDERKDAVGIRFQTEDRDLTALTSDSPCGEVTLV